MKGVNDGNGGTFFLYGYGGTSKTFIRKSLASTLRSENHIVLTVASSGIASLLLPVGRTAHSKLAIPVPTFENSTCNIHQGSKVAELLKQTMRQFPLTVSYAMTINKSQGQSLASVELYLPRPVFGHGQLYVVFSRVQSMEGLKILIHDKEGKTMNTTINVVYKEVFQNLQTCNTITPTTKCEFWYIFGDSSCFPFQIFSNTIFSM
ncbi:hypothetical protein Lal_00026919 [Lupinus albus]|nr:hypothetical protein Lal_00026919 [Lupinus albus]